MTKNIYFSLLLSAVATVSFAEETRQVDKHEHGVGELNIAIDKNIIDFEFMLPGADIVGFEYEAKSEEDLALVSNALEKFEDYKNVFIIPAEGQCNIASQEVLINKKTNMTNTMNMTNMMNMTNTMKRHTMSSMRSIHLNVIVST